MAMCLPSMKNHPAPTCLECCPGTPGMWKRLMNRLELRKGLQGCTPFFCVSMDYGFRPQPGNPVSDKIQTKTAKKETQDTTPRSPKSLYNGEVALIIAKVVIINGKCKSPLSLDHLINQSPNPDLSCLGDCLESVLGLLVNGDNHLHPLVLRICRFPPCPRSCSSPCLVCHSSPPFAALNPAS